MIKDSIGHVEVFQMDGVGTPIIGRPRPLPGHDTPNPAHNTYTLKCEEPEKERLWDKQDGRQAQREVEGPSGSEKNLHEGGAVGGVPSAEPPPTARY